MYKYTIEFNILVMCIMLGLYNQGPANYLKKTRIDPSLLNTGFLLHKNHSISVNTFHT